MIQFLRHNLYAIGWGGAMIALSFGREHSLPPLPLAGTALTFDKLAHALQMLIFTFVLLVGLHKQHTFPSLRFYALKAGIFIGLGWGLMLEIIQWLRLPQHAEALDLLANWIGVGAGAVFFYFIYIFSEKIRN